MTTREIAAHDWVKRWNEPVTLLLCSYFGDGYIHAAKDAFGVGFSHILFAYHEGVVVCYRLASDTERVGRGLAEIFMSDLHTAHLWRDALIAQTDLLTRTLEEPAESFLHAERFAQFEKQLDAYLPVFIRVNIVPDFLPQSVLDTAAPILLQARTYSEHAYHDVEALFKRVTDTVAVREGYAPGLLHNLLRDELREYLRSGVLPSQAVLEARRVASGLYVHEEGWVVLDAAEVGEVEECIASVAADDAKLSGTASTPGRATGRVRIVSDPRNAADFAEGDVLVTSMTNPDFVPLMKQAGAIITEGGGILSHAAILSRELGKPCILNIKNATRTLKDGDLVEVNADEGAVRIVERAGNTPKVGG